MNLKIASSNLNQTPLAWEKNFSNIRNSINDARKKNVKILCFPELSITGYSCQDLFFNSWFIKKSEKYLKEVVKLCDGMTVLIGHPLKYSGKLYNAVSIIKNKEIKGCFIKSNIPNDGIHYEKRWFEPWKLGEIKEHIFDKLEMNETKFHLTDDERLRLQPLRVNIKPNSVFNQTDYNLDGYTIALDGYSYREDNKAHFGGEGLVSTMNDFSRFCEMLVNDGVYNQERILSSESIKIMTSKYTNGYPDPDEPGVFPDLAGYYVGFTFSVLENPEVDGTGAGVGSYGWSGYHNTHFWIDPQNKMYGLFMARSIEFDFAIPAGLKKATYSKF